MGTYTQVGKLTDPTGDALRGAGQNITKAGITAVINKKKQDELDRVRKNKLNESLYGLDLAVSEIPALSDSSLDETTRGVLQEELNRIHKLGMDSLGGDNSEYLKEKAKFAALVKELPVQIGVLNKQALNFDESAATGVGSFLNGVNEPWAIDMLQNFNKKNGEDIGVKIVNGQWVFEYQGNIVNAGNNLKNVESGGGLIKYMKDPQESLKGIFDVTATEDYIGLTFTDTERRKGKTESKKWTDYTEQNNEIKRQLQDGTALDGQLDDKKGQNNWQYYGGEGVYDPDAEVEITDDQGGKVKVKMKDHLKKLMIDDMMNKYGHDDIVNKGESTTVDKNWTKAGPDAATLKLLQEAATTKEKHKIIKTSIASGADELLALLSSAGGGEYEIVDGEVITGSKDGKNYSYTPRIIQKIGADKDEKTGIMTDQEGNWDTPKNLSAIATNYVTDEYIKNLSTQQKKFN